MALLDLVAILGLLVPVYGQSEQREACEHRFPELRVELIDTTGLDEAASRQLRREVETIYRSAGVEIRWLHATLRKPEPGFARVFIMDLLPPTLSVRVRTFGSRPPLALGLGTETGAGGRAEAPDVSGAVVYVSRERVAETATAGAISGLPSEILGRALGRVVAHELAHRFLQRRHTRRGVLKADLSSDDLIGSGRWARFTKTEALRLRRVATPHENDRKSPDG